MKVFIMISSLLTFALVSLAGAVEPLFDSHVDYYLGEDVYGVNIGDFDKDGVNEVAVATSTMMQLIVMDRDGTGLFEISYAMPATQSLAGLCACDFNGDGNIDLAAGTNYSQSVIIFEGNGDGTFEKVQEIIYADIPTISMTAVDIDRDTDLDLVFGASGNIVVIKNDGTGVFGTPRKYAAASLNAPAVADFDGDGDIDVAAVFYYDSRVMLYANDHDSTFLAPVKVADVSYPVGGVAARLDGDADYDLAVGQYNNVTILLNNGSGSFSTGSGYAVEGEVANLAIADMGGDLVTDRNGLSQ